MDHRVVREDQQATGHIDVAHRQPGFSAGLPQRADRGEPTCPSRRELGQHDRNSDQQGQSDVEEDEGRAPTLGSGVAEAPHVAETHRTSHRSQNESGPGPEHFPLRFILVLLHLGFETL